MKMQISLYAHAWNCSYLYAIATCFMQEFCVITLQAPHQFNKQFHFGEH